MHFVVLATPLATSQGFLPGRDLAAFGTRLFTSTAPLPDLNSRVIYGPLEDEQQQPMHLTIEVGLEVGHPGQSFAGLPE